MKRTPEEWREHLASLDLMVGPSPWARASGEDSYQLAAELAAKAMLIVTDEDPTLLDIPGSVLDDYGRASYDAAWKAAEARWPGLDDWIGGITGFMFGWANNLVRYIQSRPAVGNPAIFTIRVKDR